MLNQARLKVIADKFRRVVELSWSESTAYKVPEITKYGPGISGGQCAVTCLVLKDVLEKEFPAEKFLMVSGQLQSMDERVIIRDHGWLQVGSGTETIIIDPTADQAPEIKEKVTIGTVSELEQKGLRYIEKEIESDYGELEHPNRYKRYSKLKERLEASK